VSVRLVVTEKPSVARDLARVLGIQSRTRGWIEGDGLVITWCVGHLVELQEPAHYDPAWRRWALETLPMVPERFELRPRKGAQDQWAIVRRWLTDRRVEEVVNACDAGREGELIFRFAYELAGCTRPVMRLWISSLTDVAIRSGWSKLKPSRDYDTLGDAARSRAEADWLVGLNATRAMTCRGREAGGEELLSVGRVQTPTLAMIVTRDREIAAFVPEQFWRVEAVLTTEQGSWTGRWFRQQVKAGAKEDEDVAPRVERLSTQEAASAVARAASGALGKVARADRRRKVDRPPLLYDLTSLQRRANQRYGLSAQRTLALAQALYEKHKLITYPRTDARFITPDQVALLPDVLRGLQPIPPYAASCSAILAAPIKPGKRVVNASEVGDHHAILPTGRTPRSDRLSVDEKRVFDLVARRLLAVLSPNALFDLTTLVVEVPPHGEVPKDLEVPLAFRARGRICVDIGWQAIDPPGRKRGDRVLPQVEVDDPVTCTETEVLEGQTRPPKPLTDATILRGMETAGKVLDDKELARALRSRGLGTPATRAAILQTLLDRGYVVRDKRSLLATDKGRNLIDAVPVEELKSPALTARWEGRLQDVTEARETRARFMEDVRHNLRELMDAIRGAEAPVVLLDTSGPSIGDCPACGKPVRERKRIFGCDGGRGCGFKVFKTMSKRAISGRMVKQMLKEGVSKPVKGFRSKKGRDFVAGITWDAEAGRVGFVFPPRDEGERSRVQPPGRQHSAVTREGDSCPACGQGRVIRGRAALGCSRWREGCSYRAS
jgi:DNA topoisomerase-3